MPACQNGHIDVVKILLENEAQVNLQEKNGLSSLMLASQNGHDDVVRLLLENKAQVDLQNINGWTSSMAASHNGHVDVTNLLQVMLKHNIFLIKLTYCQRK